MLFHDVCLLFLAIEKISSRTEITKLLAQLYQEADPVEARIISYMALGTLRPPYQTTQFGIAQKSMASIIAQLFETSVAAVTHKAHELGDLGNVVGEGSWSPKEHLTVQEIYERLARIEDVSGSGSQEEKSHLLLELLKTVDPLSAQIIVRIVLGTLRLGFSDMTIVDALSWMLVGNKSLHKAIENAYNLCADLGAIAQVVRADGPSGIDHIGIVVGIPIRPAAAERSPSAVDIIKRLGTCIAQPKIDGFRLQVHIDRREGHNKIAFFSRNLIDMSAMFPDLVAAFDAFDTFETLIVDGEAIAYDEKAQRFLPFQETVKRKRKHGIEEIVSEFPLKYIVFDLLYYNGRPMLERTHEERRKLLEKVLGSQPSPTIAVIDEWPIATVDDLEEHFMEAIHAGLEGLVVKRPDAIYQPGKRNFNWIKLKRHETTGGLEDTIDAVILGYYYGSGKRSKFGIGAFLVGVYNKQHDRFDTIAKIGTGLTDQEWKDLKQRCDQKADIIRPTNVHVAKELEPDVWVYPEIVCIIRADEITESPLHTAGSHHGQGYALRFPRFEGYSPDKSAHEATTVDEIRRLYQDQPSRRAHKA